MRERNKKGSVKKEENKKVTSEKRIIVRLLNFLLGSVDAGRWRLARGVLGRVREPVVDEARVWGVRFPRGAPLHGRASLGIQVQKTEWAE